jgi:cytochrome c553
MRQAVSILIVVVLAGVAASVQSQQPAPPGPSWAFQVIDGKLPPEEPGPKRIPGSTRTFTPEQIDDLLNPPDWFPDAHPPAPSIVVKGHGAALACGSCHLMNGLGHPESADLSGLPVGYFVQQMADFKSGVRRDYARMNAISKEVSDEEARQAAEWFASLKPARSTRVIEAAMVPRTFVGQGRMRFVQPNGGNEPIGTRLITVPEDQERARRRDPNSGFIVYAPVGSVARGKQLVETGGGGRTIACAICHGDALKGLGNVPRLAGLHPIYIARQLYIFKDGTRNGIDGQLMKKAVAQLTDDDVVAISAYLGSLAP